MDPKHRDDLLAAVQAVEAEHQNVLHSAYRAVADGRFEEFANFVTEDVELSISGWPPMDGIWRGRQEVVAATRKNFGMVDVQQPQIERVLAQGEMIVVLLKERGTLRADGQAYYLRAVQWFTFRDGKISRIDEICAPCADNALDVIHPT